MNKKQTLDLIGRKKELFEKELHKHKNTIGAKIY
jgi:hypothetical protein